jgi:hypothetical protein
MIKLTRLLSLAAVLLGAQAITAAAVDVPTYDVRVTCRTESQGDPGAGAVADCMADEQSAREQLVRQWAQFTAESKAGCIQIETGISNIRSYVELLTCLQMRKDAKGMPKACPRNDGKDGENR